MRSKPSSPSFSGSPTPLPDEHPEKVLRDARVLLGAVRGTLADLLQRVRNGDAGALRGLATKQAELETALKRAFEAEGKYDDWQARNGRGHGADDGEIDFDQLRRDIGSRLARIRECCQEP